MKDTVFVKCWHLQRTIQQMDCIRQIKPFKQLTVNDITTNWCALDDRECSSTSRDLMCKKVTAVQTTVSVWSTLRQKKNAECSVANHYHMMGYPRATKWMLFSRATVQSHQRDLSSHMRLPPRSLVRKSRIDVDVHKCLHIKKKCIYLP